MSNKKAIRAQRHQAQPKTIDRNAAEVQRNRTEGYEQTNKGLKKTIIYNNAKYVVDMVKE